MYNKELAFAKALALEAGEIMRKHFGFDLQPKWKSDQTPLTIADTQINSLVIEKIKAAFPGDDIFGEENQFITGSKRLWVCDPVDGTLPFSHGLPISTFSLALVIDGVPQVGVIYDPFMDRLFYAEVNSGAFYNGQPIHVSNQGMQNAILDISGFPAPADRATTTHTMSVCDRFNTAGAKTVSMWSTIINFALIASGKFTGAVFNLNFIHDVAAAKVIIDEAGGKTTDMFGNEQRYDRPTKGFIASNGVIHQQIIDLLKK